MYMLLELHVHKHVTGTIVHVSWKPLVMWLVWYPLSQLLILYYEVIWIIPYHIIQEQFCLIIFYNEVMWLTPFILFIQLFYNEVMWLAPNHIVYQAAILHWSHVTYTKSYCLPSSYFTLKSCDLHQIILFISSYCTLKSCDLHHIILFISSYCTCTSKSCDLHHIKLNPVLSTAIPNTGDTPADIR